MNISRDCITLIKHYESLAEVKEDGLIYPYQDYGGVATIGWGNTRYSNGRKVTMQDRPITKQQANELLIHIIEKVRGQVNEVLKVPLSQNEFDAIVSFTYNLGIDNFKESTLLKCVNTRQSATIVMKEFKRWVYDDGDKLSGLIKRRKSEAHLYGFGELNFY